MQRAEKSSQQIQRVEAAPRQNTDLKAAAGQIDHSPHGLKLQAIAQMMHGSQQVKSLEAMAARFAAHGQAPLQRAAIADEEEPLQGKFETAQRIGDEEELLQGKFETAQRMDDEEALLQGRFETAQREGAEDEELQMKAVPATPVQRQAEVSPSPNRTGLPDGLKAAIESLSGLAMDHVRVHYNSSQPAQLNALAYAQGSDIHIAPGQEQHLPHEAWHVVQQAQGRVRPTMQMKGNLPVNDDAGLEREADTMGQRALSEGSEPNLNLNTNAATVAHPIVQYQVFDDAYEYDGTYDHDYEDEYEDDYDEETAYYLQIPELPTLGDYLNPVLEQKQKELSEARRIQNSKAKRASKTEQYRHIHSERREIREKYRKEIAFSQEMFNEISGLIYSLKVESKLLSVLMPKAGLCKAYIAENREIIWQEKKEQCNLLCVEILEKTDLCKVFLEDCQLDLNVDLVRMRNNIQSILRFSAGCQKYRDGLFELKEPAEILIEWFQELISKKHGASGKLEIQYPNVFVHKTVKNCPGYNNIPFGELQLQLATGTHGKDAHDYPVHKKVLGGYAITFVYVGQDAFITDCGPKYQETNKYDYKRGGVSYDSTAEIGEKSQYFSE